MTKPSQTLEEIWLSSTISLGRYRKMEKARDCEGLANFLYERLSERYILPVTTGQKSGFAMMACASLLIETLESFHNGWKTTQGAGPGETAFKQFFAREARFIDFRTHGEAFHTNVRCGILHQGETKGGWRITRRWEAPVFDSQTKTIQATKFLNRLNASLRDYVNTLKTTDWSDDVWRHFRRKMRTIIKNCEAKS
jgi:hypothetical protein